MNSRLALARRVSQLGLLILSVAILAPAVNATTSSLMLAVTTTLPLLLSAVLAFRQTLRWGLWTAVLMIPYFSFALTDMLTNPNNLWSSGLIALLAVIIFFTAIDVTRLMRGRTVANQ